MNGVIRRGRAAVLCVGVLCVLCVSLCHIVSVFVTFDTATIQGLCVSCAAGVCARFSLLNSPVMVTLWPTEERCEPSGWGGVTPGAQAGGVTPGAPAFTSALSRCLSDHFPLLSDAFLFDPNPPAMMKNS